VIDTTDQLYKFNGSAFEQVISNNMIGTSVATYRFNKFKSVRFQTNLKNPGEDILFWLEIMHKTNKVFFQPTLAEDATKG